MDGPALALLSAVDESDRPLHSLLLLSPAVILLPALLPLLLLLLLLLDDGGTQTVRFAVVMSSPTPFDDGV